MAPVSRGRSRGYGGKTAATSGRIIAINYLDWLCWPGEWDMAQYRHHHPGTASQRRPRLLTTNTFRTRLWFIENILEMMTIERSQRSNLLILLLQAAGPGPVMASYNGWRRQILGNDGKVMARWPATDPHQVVANLPLFPLLWVLRTMSPKKLRPAASLALGTNPTTNKPGPRSIHRIFDVFAYRLIMRKMNKIFKISCSYFCCCQIIYYILLSLNVRDG